MEVVKLNNKQYKWKRHAKIMHIFTKLEFKNPLWRQQWDAGIGCNTSQEQTQQKQRETQLKTFYSTNNGI